MPERARCHQVFWVTIGVLLSGASGACTPDSSGLGGDGSTSEGTTGTTTGSNESVDEESGGDEGSVPCGYPGMLGGDYDISFPPRDEEDPDYKEFSPAVNGDCHFDGIFDPSDPPNPMALGTGEEFEVFVYHPLDDEGWPAGLRPAVFFGAANGNNYHIVNDDLDEDLIESDHYYRELIRSLVADGFVVFAMNFRGTNTIPASRRRAGLACIMRWAREDWPDHERLSEFMVLAGHSRGGGATYLLTEHLQQPHDGTYLPENEPGIDDWQQCALMTYAQTYNDSPWALGLLG